MPACKYVEEISSAAMLATKISAGVAPEVNLGKCVTCLPTPGVNKAAHSGFDTQRRRPQKFKIGVSVVPQKGPMSSRIEKQFVDNSPFVGH